jgi:hypothetical protein
MRAMLCTIPHHTTFLRFATLGRKQTSLSRHVVKPLHRSIVVTGGTMILFTIQH